MNVKPVVVVAATLLPFHAGAGPIDLTQDVGELEVNVTLAPTDNPDAMRIDNKSPKTILCSAHFTGADQNRTVKVTIEPGETGTIRVPGNRGSMPRSAELKCIEKTSDPE